MELGLDGDQGNIVLTPDARLREQMLAQMQQQRAKAQQRLEQAAHWRKSPGVTADGHRVLIAANIGGGGQVEAQEAAELWGAEGVGLLRTEFLFGDRATLPDEAEQTEQYSALFRAFASHAPAGAPLVVRTLDAGADKPLPALVPLVGDEPEANPALGLRGIRIHLAFPDLLRTQLRALLRAAGTTGVNLHIMFPMIATVDELRRARGLFESSRTALLREGLTVPPQVPVGIMVEVPSAVLMAGALAREADFFSIGTNDLTQYTLAADRMNGRLGSLYDVLQPAILHSIAAIVQAARSFGRMIAVCGEAAGDPGIGPLLVGLGVEELSMSPTSIPLLKETLGRFTLGQLSSLAGQALEMPMLEDTQALVAHALGASSNVP
jgi:phosphoenolpyruvate-protein kinase (PTS system EI component)